MKTINLTLPKSWNELSETQLLKVSKLLCSKEGILFDIKMFIVLLNIKWWQIKKRANMLIVLSQVPISELRNYFQFIYTNVDRTVFPAVIQIKDTTFYAPMDRLTNLSIDELSVALDLHNRFLETANPEYLHYLAATLYVQTEQPIRVFDKNVLQFKHKAFAQLHPAVLKSIEIAFSGCKQHLFNKFNLAFPKKGGSLKSSKKKYGFGKVVLQMAGGKFGTHEETKRTNCYTFLEQFEEDLRTAAKNNKK